MGCGKLNERTERAIRQMPREMRRQTKVIATIGEALLDGRIRKMNHKKEIAERLSEKFRESKLKSDGKI